MFARLRHLLLLPLAVLVLGEEKDELRTVEGVINIPKYFDNVKDGRQNLRVVLSNPLDTKLVFANSNGEFEISGVVENATYILEVFHPALFFDSVTIEVGKKGVTPYLTDYLYGKGPKLRYPLVLAPSSIKNYFEEREDFNILSLFKSPMVMMMLFMFGMVYMMPKDLQQGGGAGMKELREELRDDNSMSGKLLKKMVGEAPPPRSKKSDDQ